MARGSDALKFLEWRRRMARFQKARSSVAQFCRDEEVSAAAFYHWRKKLARQSLSKVAQQGNAPLHESHETEDVTDSVAGFTPVRLLTSPSVTVRLPGGTQLDISSADPQALTLVIQTLAQVDANRMGGDSC